MNTLTEKVNGRREWSAYGLSELQKVNDESMKAIILTNALSECGIKSIGHRSFKISPSPMMILYVTKKGNTLIKGSQGVIEEVNDPRVLFDRIRVVWGNLVLTPL